MQTNASFVRNSIAVAAALFVVACGGPQTQPTSSSPSPGSTGTGGNGSGSTGGGDGSGSGTGGTGGSGGGGGVVGTGGSGGGGGGGTGGAGGGGGTPMPMVGCYGYVQCLKAAMSAADAMACDGKATPNAQTLLGAVDTCVANYCEGMGGGTARCKAGTNGEPVNLDGSAAFDQTTGAPSGDCGTCLVNGESTLWGSACMPATDPACTATACTQQIGACTNDKP